MMSIELKIKSKTLEVEAKIIRSHERKFINQFIYHRDKQESEKAERNEFTFYNLRDHRRFVVGTEARATFLARAFIRGRPYEEVEQAGRKTEKAGQFLKLIPKILRMVHIYGGMYDVTTSDIEEWVGLKEVSYE